MDTPKDKTIAELIRILRDHSRAEAPATFPRDATAAAQPGLYSWWCDEEGRRALAAGLGSALPPLIYAGLAGATKKLSGKEGTATLFSRIRQMHLAPKIEFSTFRLTLAALLQNHLRLNVTGPLKLARESEERLTEWMHNHLRVVAVPYPDRGTLEAAEGSVLAALDPPLNLQHMLSNPVRRRLKKLRSELSRPRAEKTQTSTTSVERGAANGASARATEPGTERTRGPVLVVVPCGRQKIWDDRPNQGPTPAGDAYTSSYFRTNRAYAELFGDRWVVLSAKHGFVAPDYPIPGQYNVTFKDPSTGPIGTAVLRQQVRQQELERFETVIGLGGKEYVAMVEAAFAGTGTRTEFPFAGLPIGKMIQATQEAIQSGRLDGTQSEPNPPTAAPPDTERNSGIELESERERSRGPYTRSYEAITEWLRSQAGPIVTVQFAELERLLGRPLPNSARRHRPWWANSRGTQGSAWLEAGYRVAHVDIRRETVTFRKDYSAK